MRVHTRYLAGLLPLLVISLLYFLLVGLAASGFNIEAEQLSIIKTKAHGAFSSPLLISLIGTCYLISSGLMCIFPYPKFAKIIVISLRSLYGSLVAALSAFYVSNYLYIESTLVCLIFIAVHLLIIYTRDSIFHPSSRKWYRRNEVKLIPHSVALVCIVLFYICLQLKFQWGMFGALTLLLGTVYKMVTFVDNKIQMQQIGIIVLGTIILIGALSQAPTIFNVILENVD
ncbi:hypothetical protein JCM19235_4267 [Vibrio maritimus]|uniref:Uncharacterized protein n=1 Tax=Vibrio maritimus TaxID=990268 RepID=A0A090SKZ0_9VIBR|nr:hypothetical protein JCM19235_4267 [Vibrio maritimus]